MIDTVGHMTRNQVYEALKSHPFTRRLTESSLAKLAAIAQDVGYREDHVIFHAGERSSHLFLVVSGSVCVEIRTQVYAVCLQSLDAGEAFGWSSLLDRHYTAFQVRARERSTVLQLDAQQLLVACEGDAELGFEIFRRLSELIAKRVMATESRLADFCGGANPAVSRASSVCA
ncbi:MAG: cyclic nucleotide-binding domain-containing protein [Acidobacteria bacterium]|nr:cyclic nucleotide-binding domain-containing protein [Acidobacteriota bacterium]